MARGKYPEETVEKIIQTAARLFIAQGYENTSIQDIVNHLGGLSKGAIYHHFRSKEEIMIRVLDFIYGDEEAHFSAIINDNSRNGLQKLQALLDASITDERQQEAFSASINMLDNPQLLARQLKDTVQDTAHRLILPIVREGIADGSLAGLLYPEEFTEAFLLLSNIWANPMVFEWTPEQLERKCRFLQHFARSCGIAEPLITDEKIASLMQYAALFQKNKRCAEETATL